MFREIGGNYYNDLMFQKVIASDGNYYIEFSGGSRLGITQSEYQAIIENGYVVIGNVHYNKELISKVYTATNGKYYAEFTNGETIVLTQVEYDNIVDGNGQGGSGIVDIVLQDVELIYVTSADSGETVKALDLTFDQLQQAVDAEASGMDARFAITTEAGVDYIDLQTATDDGEISVRFWNGGIYFSYTADTATQAITISAYQVLFRRVPAVLTIPQSLTAEEQEQVLSNLGVVDAQNKSY